MSEKSNQPYLYTNAYKSFWNQITATFQGRHKEDIRAITEFIWDNFFPLSKVGIIKYELPRYLFHWKRNFHLKKYLEDKKIVQFLGNSIRIMEHAIAYLEIAEKELREPPKMEAALKMIDILNDQLKAKDDLLNQMMNLLTKDQKEEIERHLRLVKK